MSGGIAHNKMLAKLASARNMPNKQTVVSRAAVDEMLEVLPMRSIKGLGGTRRASSARASSNVSPRKTARETRRATGPRPARRGPPQSAGRGRAPGGAPRTKGGSRRRRCGLLFSNENARKRNQTSSGLDDKTFAWLERASRGEDADPVVANVRDGAKSVTAFKSFKPVFEKARAHTWLHRFSRLSSPSGSRRTGGGFRERREPFGSRARRTQRARRPAARVFRDAKQDVRVSRRRERRTGLGEHAQSGRGADARGHARVRRAGPEATSPCTRVGLAASDRARTRRARGGIERFFVSDEKPRDSSRRTEETETNEKRKTCLSRRSARFRRRDLKKNANAALTPPPATPRGFLNCRRRFRNRQKAPRRTKCVWSREPTRSWCVPAAACGPPRGATRSRTRTSTSRLTCRRASRSTGAPGRARARREGKHIRREAGRPIARRGEREAGSRRRRDRLRECLLRETVRDGCQLCYFSYVVYQTKVTKMSPHAARGRLSRRRCRTPPARRRACVGPSRPISVPRANPSQKSTTLLSSSPHIATANVAASRGYPARLYLSISGRRARARCDARSRPRGGVPVPVPVPVVRASVL